MHDRWCMTKQQGSCMVGKVCFYFVHSKEKEKQNIVLKKVISHSKKIVIIAHSSICKFFISSQPGGKNSK